MTYWFVEEIKDLWHQQRINDILDCKEYLSGKHKIKKRGDEVYKGQTFNTTKIGLDYASLLLNFETTFTLKNPVTLTSNNIEDLEEYKRVYREGKYHEIDFEILHRLVRYGEVYEYIYLDNNNRIKSHLINGEDSYPIYNRHGDLEGFIEHYTFDNISYYTVYQEDRVEEWTDEGGSLRRIGRPYYNIGGLPIPYIRPSELDPLKGQASFLDYIDIIDSMEALLSKYLDGFYKLGIDPIPILRGTHLNTKDKPSKAATGFLMQVEGDSDLEIKNSLMDSDSLKVVYNQLKQALFDVSSTPSVALNGSEVANLSETSIKMMYSLAEINATMNTKYLLKGFNKRWGKMKKIMINQLTLDIDENTYIDCEFNFNIPMNESEIINNIVKGYENNILSQERAIEINPYTIDVPQELERLQANRED